MKNLLLSILLALSLAPAPAQNTNPAPAAPASATPPKLTRDVNAAQFDQLRASTNAVILDVRTAEEYAEEHLPGAILLDYRSRDFAEKVAKLDKSKEYLVHCAGGGRSTQACTKMESLGFTNLVNLEGGLSAWKEAGKPVTK